MFADLLRRLTAPEPDRLPEPDARLALAALMVRVARSDGDYDPATANLRAQAEALEQEAPDTVRFTRAIKGAVDLEERSAVIEALWSVVLVDGERDAQEDSLLRLLANLLGINDRDSNIARKRAEEAIHPRNSQA